MNLRRALSRGWLPPLLLLAGGCSSDRPVTPPALELTGRVVDAADVLTDAEERLLSVKLAALEAHDGPQFVVATTPSLQGQNINAYSLALARGWRLGSNERNDGLLLLLAPKERRVRIEVGTGLEKSLPDELCKHIIQTMLPRPKESQTASGIELGVDALIKALRAPEVRTKAKAA